MIWGDRRLKSMVGIAIFGADEKCINPASVNLRLGHSFLKPAKWQTVKLGEEMVYESFNIADGQYIAIKPGEFMLATTMEEVIVPTNAAAFVQGRSSIGRAGLTVQNAGFVDPGFEGHITLELKNDSPCQLLLSPGYPVVQLVFMDASYVTKGYHGKYQHQVEATGSRMFLDDDSFKRT